MAAQPAPQRLIESCYAPESAEHRDAGPPPRGVRAGLGDRGRERRHRVAGLVPARRAERADARQAVARHVRHAVRRQPRGRLVHVAARTGREGHHLQRHLRAARLVHGRARPAAVGHPRAVVRVGRRAAVPVGPRSPRRTSLTRPRASARRPRATCARTARSRPRSTASRRAASAPRPPRTPPPPSGLLDYPRDAASMRESSTAERLRELDRLRDEGLITDEEYEQRRAAIVEGL